MNIRLRNLRPGDQFVLKRTGERYLFVRRCNETPAGTRYVVQRDGSLSPSTLHPACHVTRIGGAA